MEQIPVQLAAGFEAAFTLWNLGFIIIGVVIGIVMGVLPGVGSLTAIPILIPVTFYMEPVTALAFLIAITKGGTSGGAIPAILLNAPGSAENVATARDGHPLAKRGKPVKAMRMALYSSVFGDCASDVVLIALAAPFAAIALLFGPTEITAVVILAFTLIAKLSSNSLTKGLAAAALGVFLATIGLDPEDGTQRMTFGVIDLYDGISLNALAIGLLALSSVLSRLFGVWRPAGGPPPEPEPFDREQQDILWPEFRGCIRTLFRSACIGTFVGMMRASASILHRASRVAVHAADDFLSGDGERKISELAEAVPCAASITVWPRGAATLTSRSTLTAAAPFPYPAVMFLTSRAGGSRACSSDVSSPLPKRCAIRSTSHGANSPSGSTAATCSSPTVPTSAPRRRGVSITCSRARRTRSDA